MTNPNLWNQILIWPILNLLMFFYKIITLIGLPGAFGLAIIALTAVVRIVTWPLSQAQLKSAKKMQNLKPKLDALNVKYKDNKLKLQQAQMELYKTAGINPAAGCLPLLLQFPVFIALYNVFIQTLKAASDGVVASEINKVLYFPFLHTDKIDLWFFGLNLNTKPSEWQKMGVFLLLIPIITAGLQYLQTRLMTSAVPKQELVVVGEKKATDQMGDLQKQMGLIMPVMIGFFALSFPIGLALYWNVFTLFGIIQQIAINKSK